jgi:hypothetical protein
VNIQRITMTGPDFRVSFSPADASEARGEGVEGEPQASLTPEGSPRFWCRFCGRLLSEALGEMACITCSFTHMQQQLEILDMKLTAAGVNLAVAIGGVFRLEAAPG